MTTTPLARALAAPILAALALTAAPAMAAKAAKPAAAAAAPAKSGEAQFAETCSACHQPTGVGIPGAFPPLVGDKTVLGPAPAMASLVLYGRNVMPAFKDMKTDAELAAIMTYVRSAWGNKAPAVTPAVLKAARAGPPPQPQPPYGQH